ncbi:MAG: hypothetical protein IJZ51_08300 [Ruminiclostridium sp.]|nr:hypothetical protein [Ruminiclostridium sp.]
MKIKNTLSLFSAIILTFSLLCGCQQELTSDINSSDNSTTTSDVSISEDSQDESSEIESDPQTIRPLPQTSSAPETSSYPEPVKLTDDITQTDRNNDGAIATFELYYGQEWREITEDEIQLIYKRVFDDKLISDESIQERVSYIGKTIGDLEIQLYNASGEIGNELIFAGVPFENREDWFLSKKPPQLFSSMEELYEIQKDVFSDITTYEDFLTKFDAFKFEDDGFYVKGRTPGMTSTLYNTPVLPYTSFGTIRCIYSSAVAVELDGEIKMAVIRRNCLGFTKDIYSVHIVPLTEIDGVLKFPREFDWETAFGKSK